jgi:hypothetical protein
VKRWGLGLVVLVVVAVYIARLQLHDSLKPDEVATQTGPEATPIDSPPSDPTEPLQMEVPATQGGVQVPAADLNSVRSDRIKNPHLTPTAHLNFAESLAPLIAASKHDRKAADQLLVEVESCLSKSPGETSTSLRAYCLEKALNLSDQYADLGPRVAQLEQRESQQVREIAEKLKAAAPR